MSEFIEVDIANTDSKTLVNVAQIDLKQNKIDEIPFICWYSANMKKVGDV